MVEEIEGVPEWEDLEGLIEEEWVVVEVVVHLMEE